MIVDDIYEDFLERLSLLLVEVVGFWMVVLPHELSRCFWMYFGISIYIYIITSCIV